MYESDLLLFICLVLLSLYLKSLLSDFLKYNELFRRIKGPKTLPLGLIAYLFTARSESGSLGARQGDQSEQHWRPVNSFSDRFQILQKLSVKYPNFYSLWFGVKYLFVTDDPSIACKLLTYPECVEKNFFMEFFGFPNGLISLKCKWKVKVCLSLEEIIRMNEQGSWVVWVSNVKSQSRVNSLNPELKLNNKISSKQI